jgi:hypothetical protein
MKQQLSMKLKKDTSGDLSFPLSRPAHPSHYQEVRDGKGENTPPLFCSHSPHNFGTPKNNVGRGIENFVPK